MVNDSGVDVVDDLEAEEQALDALLRGLDDAAWDLPTPSPGWTVRDQVSHLAFSEELASTAASSPDTFAGLLAALLADLDRAEREPRERGRAMTPGDVLEWWRTTRTGTVAGLRAHAPGDRIPWVMGPMARTTFATARLMETWAHGHDVADAVGVVPEPTPRLRHVAELGVRTRSFSFVVRGIDVPPEPRIELLAPDGTSTWSWGPEDAAETVRGPALDLCLLVTQRRHRDDLALVADGDGADTWLSIAQCFAGPPSDGPAPRAT